MPRQGLDPSGRKPIRSASRMTTDSTGMTTDSTGMDLSAATGVARSEANQFRTSGASMSAIGRPEKCGNSWLRR